MQKSVSHSQLLFKFGPLRGTLFVAVKSENGYYHNTFVYFHTSCMHCIKYALSVWHLNFDPLLTCKRCDINVSHVHTDVNMYMYVWAYKHVLIKLMCTDSNMAVLTYCQFLEIN